MANDSHEKEFDDEVYEDKYYEENYDEEELEEDDLDQYDKDDKEEKKEKKEKEVDDDDWDDEKKVHISFACEDCDYRWDDVIIKNKDYINDDEDEIPNVACPMCGSMNVEQI